MELLWAAIGATVAAFMATMIYKSKMAATILEKRAPLEKELATVLANLASAKEQLKQAEQSITSLTKQNRELTTREQELNEALTRAQVTLEQERAAMEGRLRDLQLAKETLKQSFSALSAKALKENNEYFLTLAKENLKQFHTQSAGELEKRQQAVEQLVKPIKEALDTVRTTTLNIEKERKEAYGDLKRQLAQMATTQGALESETRNLVKALREPQVRGQWGEMQLRNAVELAGMSRYCDFSEQVNVQTDDSRLRPDMVVNLPGGKQIIVDAKAPLAGYLEAIEATTDADRTNALVRHARHIKTHIGKLGAKQYWAQFEQTPEFVVLFIPGENFFSAALGQDQSLIEEGIRQGVVVATPTTLIALLKAVAYGWTQESLAAHAREISQLGQTVYERLATMTAHLAKLGKSLDQGVGAYNQTIGSLERQLLPAARRFTDLGIQSKKPVADLSPVERQARTIANPELLPPTE